MINPNNTHAYVCNNLKQIDELSYNDALAAQEVIFDQAISLFLRIEKLIANNKCDQEYLLNLIDSSLIKLTDMKKKERKRLEEKNNGINNDFFKKCYIRRKTKLIPEPIIKKSASALTPAADADFAA